MARKKSAAKKARELKEAEIAKYENSDKPLPVEIEDLKRELREEEAEDEDEEDDEEEDDYGILLTENVENGLNEVLKAIKTGDKRLFDPSVTFFKDEAEGNGDEDNKTNDHKPLYLKEYHRKALLADKEAESIMTSVDDVKPYALQQKEDKENLIKEIHNAIGSDDDEESDDDFLVKKESKRDIASKNASIALPDPKEDGEKFLEAFMENHAWLPDKGEEVTMKDEDDPLFDQAAETFENAYNFRYEDPKSTEIISYARSQATMRREKMNSRKRDRLKQQEENRHEKEEINNELKKKKQKTTNLVADRIKEIKEAVGDSVSEDKIIEVFGDSLINEDFDNKEWDAKMNQIFNDEYYGNDDETFKKPEWSDDELADEENDEEENGKEEQVEEKKETDEKKSSKSKKKEEKYDKKKEKNKIKELAEKLVESKTLDLLEQVEEERGRDKKKSQYTFKYREVSPESFGLTYNEIFKADDKDLNELIGLKKLAPYRPKEKIAKDKRKITKSKNMREWRKKTFGDEKGIPENEQLEIAIPSIVFDNKKHQKSKHRKKTNSKSTK